MALVASLGLLHPQILSLEVVLFKGGRSTVTGTVTQAGLPVRDAEVTFLTSGRPTSVGTTDAEGRFTLSTRRLNDGAYAGQHVVVITKSPPSARPDKYQSPETTPLRAEVVAGRANTVTFDLSQ